MRKHGLPVLVAGAILLGCASQDRSQGGGAAGTTLSAQPGFLTKIGRIPEIERHCATAVTQAGPVNCPWTLSAGGRPSGAGGQTSTILANLPHLRMDVVLRRMENKIVSGGGVKNPVELENITVASWTLSSNAATSILAQTYPRRLPAPPPGESWDITHNDHLFGGIIQNGCSNTTEFDIALQSSVHDFDDHTFGEVSLSDETVGSGYYSFRYKIRATGLDGGVSDFFFSGEVPVTCVAEATI
jgi:hypothetical protein